MEPCNEYGIKLEFHKKKKSCKCSFCHISCYADSGLGQSSVNLHCRASIYAF